MGRKGIYVFVCEVHLIHSTLLVQLVRSILIPILSCNDLSVEGQINFDFVWP